MEEPPSCLAVRYSRCRCRYSFSRGSTAVTCSRLSSAAIAASVKSPVSLATRTNFLTLG
jgi:hypothetical protein